MENENKNLKGRKWLIQLIFVLVLIIIILVVYIFEIMSEKNISKKDIFENNLKCFEFLEQEEKKASDELLPLSYDYNYIFDLNVFYSPKINTCLSYFIIKGVNENEEYNAWYIKDILRNSETHSVYFSGKISHFNNDDEMEEKLKINNEFYNKIEELKSIK